MLRQNHAGRSTDTGLGLGAGKTLRAFRKWPPATSGKKSCGAGWTALGWAWRCGHVDTLDLAFPRLFRPPSCSAPPLPPPPSPPTAHAVPSGFASKIPLTPPDLRLLSPLASLPFMAWKRRSAEHLTVRLGVFSAPRGIPRATLPRTHLGTSA